MIGRKILSVLFFAGNFFCWIGCDVSPSVVKTPVPKAMPVAPAEPQKYIPLSKPKIVKVPQTVVQQIVKERTVKPAPSDAPTASEIAQWALPNLPAFELVFEHHVERGGSIIAHPDGKSFIHSGERLARWDLGSREPRRVYHLSSDSLVTAIALMAKEKRLIAGDDQGVLRIWDVDSGELLATQQHEQSNHGIAAIAVSPDAQTIVAKSKYGPVVQYDDMLKTKEAARYKSTRNHLFFFDNHQLVLMGEGTEIWDLDTNQQVARLKSRSLRQASLICPGGSSFVYKTLRGIHRYSKGKTEFYNIPEDTYASDTLLYSPDGKLLVIGDEHQLDFFEVKSNKRFQSIDTASLNDICWIPGSNLLLTTSRNGMIRILGDPKEAAKHDLTRLPTAEVSPPSDRTVIPTVAQLKSIFDLRSLPKLPRFMPTTDDHCDLWYQTPETVKTIRKFYRHLLTSRGWIEVATKQRGLHNSNLEFRKNGYALYLNAHRTRNSRAQLMRVLGGSGSANKAVDENVSSVSLLVTDFTDISAFSFKDSTSWELIEESYQRQTYRSNDSIVGCEVEVLRKCAKDHWTFFDNRTATPRHISNSDDRWYQQRKFRFVKGGCELSVLIEPARDRKGSFSIDVRCFALRYPTMPIPPDCSHITSWVQIELKTELGRPEAQAFFDTRMRTDGWFKKNLDTDTLCRTMYTKGLREVIYRFETQEQRTRVVREIERDIAWNPNVDEQPIVEAADFPTPSAVQFPQYERQSIQFVTKKSWSEIRDTYVNFLKPHGFEGQPQKKALATLNFANGRERISIEFDSQANGLGVTIKGRGLSWQKPCPTEKPLILSYSNWLRKIDREFSYEHLDEFESEMLEILDENKAQ